MKACAKHMFAKAARRSVRVPDNFADQVEGALVRRCLSLVGLARRAGQAVVGYEKSREWLKSGRAGIVVAASDGSAAGRAKLEALASGVPIAVLRADELGAAAGRDRAVHMVVSLGSLADSLKREAKRLAGFREADVRVINRPGVDGKHL
jgi:ribosomal protein L7Ae-like RNA K-turn-binding protein